MSRSYTPLPPSASMACSETALLFTFSWQRTELLDPYRQSRAARLTPAAPVQSFPIASPQQGQGISGGVESESSRRVGDSNTQI
jgi:hypothetical protein